MQLKIWHKNNMKTLTPEDISEIHEEILKISGGLRGSCLSRPVDSVLFRVYNHINYKGVRDLAEIGALYAYCIASGHPFNDGNKRTAMTSMLVFFDLNNIKFIAKDAEIVDKMVKVADNELSLTSFVRWVKQYAK